MGWWPGASDQAELSRPGVGLQNLLLGLGTALVAVAAIVFTAVNWDRMGASAQGLVLLVLTGLAVGASRLAARRSMPATAEALGLVSLLAALADIHALRIGTSAGADPMWFWAAGIAVVSLLGWSLGSALNLRSTRAAAAVLAQVPLLLVLDRVVDSPVAGALMVLLQSAAVLHAVITPTAAPRLARVVGGAAASLVGAGGAIVAVAAMVEAAPGDRLAPALVVALAAALVVSILARRPDDDIFDQPALLVATWLGAASVAGGLSAVAAGDAYLVALSAITVGVLALAVRGPARWGTIPGWTAAVVGMAAGWPLLARSAGLTVAAALDQTGGPHSAGVEASDRAAGLVAALGSLPPAWALGAQLSVLALAVVALRPVIGRSEVGVGLVGVVAMAVLVAPLLMPLSVGGAVVVCMLAAAAAIALAGTGPRSVVRVGMLAGFAAGVGGLGLCWASATEATLLAGLGVSVAIAAGAVHAGRRVRSLAVGVPAVFIGVGLVAAEVAAVAANRGASDVRSMVLASVAALLVGLAGSLLADPEGRGQAHDAILGLVAESTGWLIHAFALVAVIASPNADDLTLVLSAGVLAAGLHAARAGRRWLALVAAAEGLALSWVRLADAGVTTVEAYTLPVALLLLLVGLWTAQRVPSGHHNLPSWVVEGPALVVAFAPTVLVALQDPGLVRPLVGLAAGAIVLSVGAWTGRRAPVDVGVGVVVALGLRQLGPVVSGLPNWVTIGASGVLLLAVGATFEQRRRDLYDVRDRYDALT